MNFIIGELIYSSGCLKVTKHQLGYTITDGENVKATDILPLLVNSHLYALLGSAKRIISYENWQLKKKGNILLETPPHDDRSVQECDAEKFAQRLAEHYEMQMDDHMGY